MPLYEFECDKCGVDFEELVRSSTAVDEVTCPKCGERQVHKKVSTFASRVVGGGSFSFNSAPSCSTGST
jgi:putative FmdB family regulatory protein